MFKRLRESEGQNLPWGRQGRKSEGHEKFFLPPTSHLLLSTKLPPAPQILGFQIISIILPHSPYPLQITSFNISPTFHSAHNYQP